MAERITYPEFRAEQGPTNYPFAEQATLVNTEGDMVIPDVFFDARLYPVGGAPRMFLSRVVVTHQTVTLYISDSDTTDIASGEIDLLDLPDHVRLVDAYDRPAGILVSEAGRLAVFQGWTFGEHKFEVGQTEFAATVCVPTPEIGVRGIRIPDGTVFTGDVWIVGDEGVVLRAEDATVDTNDGPQTLQLIRADVVGDPLFRRRLCGDNPDLFATPRFIKTVTVVYGDSSFVCTPDDHGDLQILVNDNLGPQTVLRIRSSADGLTIEAVGESTQAASP